MTRIKTDNRTVALKRRNIVRRLRTKVTRLRADVELVITNYLGMDDFERELHKVLLAVCEADEQLTVAESKI